MTIRFVRALQPQVIVSFGSYASFPAVAAGWVSKIPIVVHEQNRVMGKANHLASRVARVVATSFPETEGVLDGHRYKYVGFPLRARLREGAERLLDEGWSAKRVPVLLVFGGSQGSERINTVFLRFLEQLTPKEKTEFAVIHIVGKRNFEAIRHHYDELKVGRRVYAFAEEMEKLYQEADIVISRAGAGTLFELAAFGRASILIPYPHAYSHQLKNAEDLLNRGSAVVIREEMLTPECLRRAVFDLLRNHERRETLGRAIRELDVPDAVQRLVGVAESCVRNDTAEVCAVRGES